MSVTDGQRDMPGAAEAGAICIVAGLPGPLLHWTCNVLHSAMALTHPNIEHVPLDDDSVHRLHDTIDRATGRLFVGNTVNEAWQAEIRRGRVPSVLVLEDADAAIAHFQDAGQPLDEAIRNACVIAMSLGDLVDSARVMTVTRSNFDGARNVVAELRRHAGFAAGDSDSASAHPAPEPVTPPLPRTDDMVAVLEEVLRPSCLYGLTGQRVPITWPRACLMWGDRPGHPVPRIIDLTGPARILTYGPYVPLPPGAWRMNVTLAISRTACGTPLSLKLQGRSALGRFAFTADQPGLYKASFPVRVRSPREVLECYLETERGAIEGCIGVDRIAFEPEDS